MTKITIKNDKPLNQNKYLTAKDLRQGDIFQVENEGRWFEHTYIALNLRECVSLNNGGICYFTSEQRVRIFKKMELSEIIQFRGN